MEACSMRNSFLAKDLIHRMMPAINKISSASIYIPYIAIPEICSGDNVCMTVAASLDCRLLSTSSETRDPIVRGITDPQKLKAI